MTPIHRWFSARKPEVTGPKLTFSRSNRHDWPVQPIKSSADMPNLVIISHQSLKKWHCGSKKIHLDKFPLYAALHNRYNEFRNSVCWLIHWYIHLCHWQISKKWVTDQWYMKVTDVELKEGPDRQSRGPQSCWRLSPLWRPFKISIKISYSGVYSQKGNPATLGNSMMIWLPEEDHSSFEAPQPERASCSGL